MIGWEIVKMTKEFIAETLNYYFPTPDCELHYKHDYELLLSVMLSAQTTDKRVNEVMDPIFKKYNTLEKLDKLSIKELENMLKSIGFYHNKAKNFKGIVTKLKEKGFVPNDRDYLESLPGVGRKTANVVLGELYNEPVIAVDTHVSRVSKRLGIAKLNDDVSVIEKKLMKKFDKETWNKLHLQLVLFGRYRCKAVAPLCDGCKFYNDCKKIKADKKCKK